MEFILLMQHKHLEKSLVDFSKFDFQFSSISSHKIGGPKGIGALIVKDINNLNSFIKGGGQEFGKRSGTENLMNIQGFAKSIEDRLFEINSGKWDEIQIKSRLFGRNDIE